MNANPRRLFLGSVLSLVSVGMLAQQPASFPPAANEPASEPSPRTMDGVPSCRAMDSAPRRLYRVGRGVQAPIPQYAPQAVPPEEAREFLRSPHLSKAPVSFMGVVVDENGRPRDICVLKEAGHGLDKAAFDTVARYRFRPATFHGKPVPVRVIIEVNFKPL